MTIETQTNSPSFEEIECLFEASDGLCERRLLPVEMDADGNVCEMSVFGSPVLTPVGRTLIVGWGLIDDAQGVRVEREGAGAYLISSADWVRCGGKLPRD